MKKSPVLVAICLILVISFMRIFFGADLTDEAQYISQVNGLFWGGKAFYSDLFIQQIASILYYPFFYKRDILNPAIHRH